MNPHKQDDTDELIGEPIYRIPDDLIVGDVFTLSAPPENWGIKVLDVQALRDESDGTGEVIGVVDTGIDPTHELFTGKIVATRDFTGSPSGSADRQGHGTHVAGTAAGLNPDVGVASGAKLVIGKGLGDGGSGSGSGIASAMRFCFDNGARIISMSLGSSGLDPQIDAVGKELTEKGAWIVCATGNSGPNTPDVDFPGRLPWAISVGAVDSSLRVANFSSSGKKINTAGPGVNILSARPGGGYQTMSGSSMSTPFAAGLLACYRGALKKKGLPIPTTAELQKILIDRSIDVDQPGVDRRSGPGVASPTLLKLSLTPLPPPVTA